MKAKKIKLAIVIGIMAAGVFTSNVLNAQVTIGGDVAPAKGAILDLNSDTKGGLLFPNIEITNTSQIPTGENGFAGGPFDGAAELALKGTVIYKPTDANDIPAGLYVWTGAEWIKLADDALKQDKLTAYGAANLLVAPSTEGGQPTTMPIADFAPQSTTYTKTQIDDAYGTKTSLTGTGVNVAATYKYVSPIEKHIKCTSFNTESGSGTYTFHIRLCPQNTYSRYQIELAGRYVYTTAPIIIYNGADGAALAKESGSLTYNGSYTASPAIVNVSGYIWLRITTTNQQVNNLWIKIIAPNTNADVNVTTNNPTGGAWLNLSTGNTE